MLLILLGSIIGFAMVHELSDVNDRKPGDTVIRLDVNQSFVHDQVVNVEPFVVQKFRNVVRQQYDYSCGSAALTTLLDFYLGRNFQERQVMEGLLRFGETERIVQRRGFSLLDMKRLVTALGHPSGGFRAQEKDLIALDHPAIAPIEYAGFKHFVVIRAVHEGRVFVADPALGNLSFTLHRFMEIWDDNVLFIVFPNGHKPTNGLELRDEDLRFVSDYLIAENSFREFPILAMKYEDKISNQIAQLNNNARSTIEVRVDEGGNAVRRYKLDEQGKRVPGDPGVLLYDNLVFDIHGDDARRKEKTDPNNVDPDNVDPDNVDNSNNEPAIHLGRSLRQSELNAITTKDPFESIEKSLRFRRK